MPNAEQRDIAEALFEPKQSREEIKNAIKLEEARGYGQNDGGSIALAVSRYLRQSFAPHLS